MKGEEGKGKAEVNLKLYGELAGRLAGKEWNVKQGNKGRFILEVRKEYTCQEVFKVIALSGRQNHA